MRKLTFRTTGFCLSVLLMVMVTAALVQGGAVSGTPERAFAQFLDPTSTANVSMYVTPGSLTFTNGAPSVPTAVTLANNDQPQTYTIPITVSDNTGSGAGWNLQIVMTAFVNGTNPALSANATTIGSPSISACQGGTCSRPTNDITSYPLTPTADGAAQMKFFGATATTGMGSTIITPSFTTMIPANAYVGTYISIFTITLNTGP